MRALLLTILIGFPLILPAQSYHWLDHGPLSFDLNPEYPNHVIAARKDSGAIIARMQTATSTYGQAAFGNYQILFYNADGSFSFGFSLAGQVNVSILEHSADGMVYIGGDFTGTIGIEGGGSLHATSSATAPQSFLIKFADTGSFQWSRNLSEDITGGRLTALALDQQNRCWIALEAQDGFVGAIYRVTEPEGYEDERVIAGIRSLSSISFDPLDDLFIAGSTQSGTIQIGTTQLSVPETYMQFAARLTPSGTTSWIRLAHDITFQRPVITADPFGNAFLGGSLMDSLSWGTVHFDAPAFGSEFYLVKVDATGDFIWGQDIPEQPVLSGDLQPATGKFIGSDGAGRAYVSGTTRGILQMGNNVQAGTLALPSTSLAVICYGSDGTPEWAVSGGGAAFQQMKNISVNNSGDVYFAAAMSGPGVFGPELVNSSAGQNSVYGLIDGVPLGINSIPGNELKIYPNPGNGIFNFSAEIKGEYLIYDAAGKLCKTGILNANFIDAQLLENGFYTLILKTGNDFKIVKVVIAE